MKIKLLSILFYFPSLVTVTAILSFVVGAYVGLERGWTTVSILLYVVYVFLASCSIHIGLALSIRGIKNRRGRAP